MRAVKLKNPTDVTRLPFAHYDFIFVDIGAHTGDEELVIHNRLNAEGWEGFVLYDDITWPGIQKFWAQVSNEKASMPWHLGADMGLVKYDK